MQDELPCREEGTEPVQDQLSARHQGQLHIEIQGQHIRGSPFNMAVKSPIEKLGTPIQTIGGVIAPWGVAISHGGEVVVAEHGGDCIAVFSPSGEKLRPFGTCGSDPGQVRYPREVAVDGEENILLTDSGNHRIQKFTSEGQYSTSTAVDIFNFLSHLTLATTVCTWEIPIITVFRFWILTSPPLEPLGSVAVAGDSSVLRVAWPVTIGNGDFVMTFGAMGKGPGGFAYPKGLAVIKNGVVYVCDADNNRVKFFTRCLHYYSVFTT